MISIEPAHLEIIKEILGENINHFQVFGSRAKGTHKPLSDLDLVYDNSISDLEIIRITHAFDESMLPYKVDIVNLANCSDAFKQLIEADRKSF